MARDAEDRVGDRLGEPVKVSATTRTPILSDSDFHLDDRFLLRVEPNAVKGTNPREGPPFSKGWVLTATTLIVTAASVIPTSSIVTGTRLLFPIDT
jgi:hypothetical protein